MLRREEMLHLALMSSENRAANALGRHFPGGLNAFVAAMNRKAIELGMNDTHYVEPTGLSSRNQSSARDLATLVKAAHEHQIIRELSTSPEFQVEIGNRPQQFRNNNLVAALPDRPRNRLLTEAGPARHSGQDGRSQLIMVSSLPRGYSRIGVPSACAAGQ